MHIKHIHFSIHDLFKVSISKERTVANSKNLGGGHQQQIVHFSFSILFYVFKIWGEGHNTPGTQSWLRPCNNRQALKILRFCNAYSITQFCITETATAYQVTGVLLMHFNFSKWITPSFSICNLCLASNTQIVMYVHRCSICFCKSWASLVRPIETFFFVECSLKCHETNCRKSPTAKG